MSKNEETSLHSNVQLIYEYTENTLKDINASLDNTTTKLTAIVAFSGVLLRFLSDLEGGGYLFTFKALSCFFALLTIGFCGTGLLSKESGQVIEPKELVEAQWYRASEEEVKLYIIRQWLECIVQLDALLQERTTYLNWAIKSLIFASIVFATNIFLSFIK